MAKECPTCGHVFKDNDSTMVCPLCKCNLKEESPMSVQNVYRAEMTKSYACKMLLDKLNENDLYCDKEFFDKFQNECVETNLIVKWYPIYTATVEIESFSFDYNEVTSYTTGYSGTISGDTVKVTPNKEYSYSTRKIKAKAWDLNDYFDNKESHIVTATVAHEILGEIDYGDKTVTDENGFLCKVGGKPTVKENITFDTCEVKALKQKSINEAKAKARYRCECYVRNYSSSGGKVKTLQIEQKLISEEIVFSPVYIFSIDGYEYTIDAIKKKMISFNYKKSKKYDEILNDMRKEDEKLHKKGWIPFFIDLLIVLGELIASYTVAGVNGFFYGAILYIDAEGKLIPHAKIRTKKKVIRAIVKKMEEHAQDGREYCGKVAISYSACLEDARKVRDLILEMFPNIQGISMDSVGTVIGSHTGPGTVALFFMGDKRVEASLSSKENGR